MISVETSPTDLLRTNWRSLSNISSSAEAAMLSAYCRFSLATVEFLFSPTNVFCALIEQEYPGVWRWAVYDTQDIVLMEGAEPTQTEAKQAAVDGLMNNRHACI